MFEFLFKYSRVVYEEGIWAIRYMPAWGWLVLILAIVVLLFALIYRKTIAPTSTLFKGLLATLKAVAILLILLMLAEPFISITTIVPKKGTVLVLLDDSESMSIKDENGQQRRVDKVDAWYGNQENAGVRKALEENFNVLTYRFDEKASPVNEKDILSADGKFTDIASALQFAAKQTQTHPVSSVIIVTDGVQTSQNKKDGNTENVQKDPLQVAAILKNASIPIYTVGVGSEIRNDIQLTNVTSSRSVTENDIVEMTALVHSRIGDARKVNLELLEDGRIIDSREITLANKYNRVNLTHKPTKKGHLQYTARVVPEKDEIITVNNEKHFLVNNEDRIARILYVEELHPWEFKFIKRAIDLDKSLQLVSLVRTGPEKFYRQGIRNQNELANGFPASKGELFSYQAVIIGSISADFLAQDQLDMLKAFVSERGGGLLMLGGPQSFSQGGWQNTPIAEILPVELLNEADAAKHYFNPLRLKEFKLQLTPEGVRSPILQFSTEEQQNRELWEEIPDLKGYNPVGAAKPGATVLALHPLSQPDREKIILAEQRYGRGRSMIIATSTTWLWQMQLEAADMRHETFWRQVVRWLALSAPDPVAVTLEKDNYNPGESVSLQVNALDSSFSAVKNAQITVSVASPFKSANNESTQISRGDPPVGAIRMLDVLPDLSRPGQYKADFVPKEEGMYEIEVQATDQAGKFLGRSTASFFVSENHVEFNRPDLQEPLLKRIAEISEGKYMHISAADNIADQLAIAKSSYSKTVERDIWDSPAVYFAILLLLAAEWATRRARGLS